jgi:trimethylamine--corrinoid protein Co-methyltransferase
LDQQAGMEWTASIMTDALNGANLIHDVGYLGQGLIGHPGALVMCAEIISYVKRFIQGFGLDDDRLALDLIEAVGPGGEFISTDHTMTHFKSEHWQPRLINRDDPETWQAKGGHDWGEKAVARAREILSDHTPEPLGQGVAEQLKGILKKGATVLQGKQIRA